MNGEERPPPHIGWSGLRSEAGGTFLRSNFFVFLVGQTLTLLLIGTVAFAKLNDLYEWKGRTQTSLERMDALGTNASRWGIKEELDRIDANSVAIKELQDQTRKIDVLTEKVARIDENVRKMESKGTKP